MTPGKRTSPPVALIPTTRPCLLACVPRGTSTRFPVTQSTVSTQSPAPRRPPAVDARLHARVGHDPARLPDGDPGLAGEPAVGAHARPEHDEVGRERPARGADGAHATIVGVEPLDPLAHVQRHSHGT